MIVLFRILGKRCDDTADAGGEKGLDDFHFLFIRFVTLCHDYVVTGFGGCHFNAAQYARKKMMHQLRYNHTNRVASARTEVDGKHIGLIIMFARVSMNKVTCLPADVRIILERSRHSGGRDI